MSSEVQQKEGKGKIKIAILVGAIVLVAGLAIFMAAGGGQSSSTSNSTPASTSNSASASTPVAKMVKVPNLKLDEVEDAEDTLRKVNLKLGTVTEEENKEYPAGLVLSTDPKEGETVAEGSSVNVIVAKGLNEVSIPNVTGLAPDEAKKKLAEAWVVPVLADPVYSQVVEPGKVCVQSIQAGAKVKPFTQIAIATSLGKEQVEVPYVVGETIDDARTTLEERSFVCNVTLVYSDTVAKDKVIAQSIENGTMVDKGTQITLEVSQGKKPVSKVVVPDVEYYDLDSARRAIESAGLKCSWEGDEYGDVVDISPAAGTEVEQGSEVTIKLEVAVQVQGTVESEGSSNDDGGTGNNAQTGDDGYLTQEEVEDIISHAGLGEIVTITTFENNGDTIWSVITKDADGVTHNYAVDQQGYIIGV